MPLSQKKSVLLSRSGGREAVVQFVFIAALLEWAKIRMGKEGGRWKTLVIVLQEKSTSLGFRGIAFLVANYLKLH